MAKFDLNHAVAKIAQNYQADGIFFTHPDHHFPNKNEVIDILNNVRRVMFPRYFGPEIPTGIAPEYFIGDTLIRIQDALCHELHEAFWFECDKDGEECKHTPEEIDKKVEDVCDYFMSRIPQLQELLLKDVQAAFDGDPAAQTKEEIIFSYPGFHAIFVYRVAHELYVKNVPLIPRIMTEYAHAQTGVDINAGAKIGEYFFIDHATGVVIGETTIIGNNVKIYQGVTLGALSTRAGQRLSGEKRHPTICDNVTIYSNASVLGGQTVIGEGSIIGGSAFVTESTPAGARVAAVTQNALNTRCPHADNWFNE